MADGGVSAINTNVDDTIEARGTQMLEVATRPEWRPDFRVPEECSDDQITRVRS